MAGPFCTNCGHRNPPDAKFCSSCGTRLERGEEDPATMTLSAVEVAETVDAGTIGAEDLPAGTGMVWVSRGPGAGSKFVLNEPVTRAGRHPDSDIFLDDVTVSRRHAEFRRGEGGYRLHDVGSLNGTYINRERVEDAPLANGDEIQIGRFRLLYLGPSLG